MNRHALAITTALAGIALAVSACSSSGGTASTDTSTSSHAMPTSSASLSAAAAAGGQFGPACTQVPTDPSNPGSFDAMAQVPVATAASGNPVLSTLVTAVKKAGLVDTLNSAQHHPANRAPARRPREPMTRKIGQVDR